MYRNRIVYLGDTRVSWKLDMNLGNGRDGFSQSFHCVIGPKLSNFIVLDNFYRVHVLIGSLNKIVFGYQRILVLHIKILCMNQQVFYYLKTLAIIYVGTISLIIESGEMLSVQNAHTV